MQFFRSLVLTLTIAMLMFTSCGTVKHQPTTNTQTTTIIKDSLIVRTDTLVIPVPVESHSSVAYQHSRLETSVAWSEAEVDTLGLLHHQIENKPTALKKEVVYVDRIVTEYRDSLVTKEIPVEVEVVREVTPKWVWWLVFLNVLICIAIGIKAYLKFQRISK